MRAVGIIAEYNPFHNGHAFHLQESLRLSGADCSVAVMSGNFLQRGEPAMWDKWSRAEAAVRNGIDLVLELPVAFACNNAEFFAKGAVEILSRLGCISHLSFGSESGTLPALITTARLLVNEDETFQELLKEEMEKGVSFPRARYEAVKRSAGNDVAAVLEDPNNILAVEYLRQLLMLSDPRAIEPKQLKMEPLTIKRHGAGYHDQSISDRIASASAIRRKMEETLDLEQIQNVVPVETLGVLKKINSSDYRILNDFYQQIVSRILIGKQEELERIFSVSEGLENRMKGAVIHSKDIQSLVKGIKSKRYTETRVQRTLIQTLLGLTKERFAELQDPSFFYGRVLAFSEKGAALLRQIKKDEATSLPIITNINKELQKDAPQQKLLHYDILASDLYHLAGGKALYDESDYVKRPWFSK